MSEATEATESRDILIITADAVKDTGTISFRFMSEADPKGTLRPMPQKYGYIWHDRKDGSRFFNVIERGRLVVGGGWTKNDKPEWEKEILDALPSCTLLMDVDELPWWTELTKRHGVEFRHHHVSGILKSA